MKPAPVVPPTPPTRPPTPPTPTQEKSVEQPVAQPAERPVGKSAAEPTERPHASSRAAASKSETLAPAVAAELADAEAALDAGRGGDAIRLAQHSLYAQKSSRAYAIIARARCAQGDLGNAKAALAQVGAHDRAAVVRACGKLGVELH